MAQNLQSLRVIMALVLALILWIELPVRAEQSASGLHNFELVPMETANRGKAPLASLKENAAQEGFFNKLFGTDCWTQALKIVDHSCRKLSSEQQARLAVALYNCHMRLSGKLTTRCEEDMSIKECTGQMDDASFIVYSNFVQHVESMCLFILNQDFDRHTEHLINVLHGATQSAKDNLAAVASELSQQGASLREVGTALEGVASHQQHLADGVAAASEGVQRLELAGEAMNQVLNKSLGQGEALLEKHEEVKGTLEAFRMQQAAAAAEAMKHWEAANGWALSLEKKQLHALEFQESILEEAQKMASETSFVRDAVDLVLDYERRSDKLMLLLLGRSYTLEDVMFYVTGLVAVVAATALPSARAARIPSLLLLALTMLAERISVTSDSPFLQVDRQGTAMLFLPTISSILEAAVTGNSSILFPWPDSEDQQHVIAMDYKWLVRKVWICVGAAMILHRMIAYQDFERENHKILKRLEQQMKDSEKSLIDAMRAMEEKFAKDQEEFKQQAFLNGLVPGPFLLTEDAQQLHPDTRGSGSAILDSAATARIQKRLGQVRKASGPCASADLVADELADAMDGPSRPAAPDPCIAPQQQVQYGDGTSSLSIKHQKSIAEKSALENCVAVADPIGCAADGGGKGSKRQKEEKGKSETKKSGNSQAADCTTTEPVNKKARQGVSGPGDAFAEQQGKAESGNKRTSPPAPPEKSAGGSTGRKSKAQKVQ